MADPVQRAQDNVRQTVIDIGGIIDGVAERVKGIVSDALKAIFEPLGAALEAQLQVFGDLVSGLLGNLATPQDVAQGILEHWTQLPSDSGMGATAVAQWVVNNLGKAWGQNIADSAAPKELPIGDALSSDQPAPPHIGSIYDDFKSKPGWYQAIWYGLFTVLLTGAFGNELYSAELSALRQSVAIDNPVEPLSPAELAQAVVQNQVGQDWAESQAKRSGLSPELFDIAVKTAGLPPGLSEMLSLLNRGLVDEETVRQSVAESHTKTKYTDALLNLRYAVPTIAEITHWLTRDAFIDDFVQRYGMDSEYGLSADKADPLFQANAVSPDYIKYIWRAHWTLPSPGAGAEMFYRTDPNGAGEEIQLPGGGTTKRIISQDDLQRLYRAAGFEPWWRAPLLKIAFNPLNRIDARRLYMAEIIDDGEFYRSVLNLGYDEPTAQLFLTWMQAQKAAAQKKQVEHHIAPIIASMRNAYKRGLIGAGEFKQQAVALGEDGDVVDVWTAQLDTERETERATKLRDGLHRLYVDGFITEDEAGNRLQAENFTSAEWMRLRDDWRVDRELRTLSDDAKATRALTKAQLITAYKDGLIARDELVQHLQSMGYHDDEIALWVEQADFDEQQRIASVSREAIHEDYVDQIIDVVAARSQLADIGIQPAQAEALLRRWTSERRRRTPNLSAAQIESAFKNKVLDEQKARDLLGSLRYTSDEIDVLIGNWSLEVGISQQRLQLEQQRLADQEAQTAFRNQQQATQFQQRQDAAASRQAQQEAFAQAQQARQQEAAVQRAATAFANQQAAQARTLQAAADRQQKTLDAAKQRETAQLAERDKALAQQQQLHQAAQAATDARQQKSLQAAADRQAAVFQQQDKLYQQRVQDRIAAEQRAQGYQLAKEQRQQQYEQAKEQRTNALKIAGELRAQRRELEKELRSQGFAIAKEQRQTTQRIATEQRSSERRSALAAAQAQAESTIANLRLQQQQTQGQSAEDIYNQVVQGIQSQIQGLPTGQ